MGRKHGFLISLCKWIMQKKPSLKGNDMLTKWIIIIIGLIGGIAVWIQTPIAGAMGQRIGGTASSVVVHLSGFILSAVLLLLRGGDKIWDWNTLPWYMLIAGFFGRAFISDDHHCFTPFGSDADVGADHQRTASDRDGVRLLWLAGGHCTPDGHYAQCRDCLAGTGGISHC
jgi:hypothetical protein